MLLAAASRVARAARPASLAATRGLAKKKKGGGRKARKTANEAPASDADAGAVDIFADAFDAPLAAGLDKAVGGLAATLGRMRGNAPSAELFEGCSVDAYGAAAPLATVAHVAIRSPTLVEVSCFDPQLAGPVADALRGLEGLSLNPTVSGSDVLVPVPRPSREQRAALAKAAAQAAEAARTRARGLRKAAHDELKRAAPAHSEDDVRGKRGDIDARVDAATAEIARLLDGKRRDLLGDAA